MFDKLNQLKAYLYDQFIAIKDTPQRIALGFAVGVVLGILPFTGVIAAVSVAWFFRLNKAAAILGSVITNTWLGILLFGVALQLGSISLGINGSEIKAEFEHLIKDFHFYRLIDAFTLKILLALGIGYLIVSLIAGIFSYVLCLIALKWRLK